MREFGIFLMVIGLLAGAFALSVDVTVSSGAIYERTYNLHKASQQLMGMLLALGTFISGAVLCGCGEIASKLAELKRAEVAAAGRNDIERAAASTVGADQENLRGEDGDADAAGDQSMLPASIEYQYDPRVIGGLCLVIVLGGLMVFWLATT